MRRHSFACSPSLVCGLLFTIVFVILSAGLLPTTSHAATLLSGRAVTVSSSTPDNTYVAAGQVNVNTAAQADLCAVGGTITVSAPVGRDALLVGGTIDIQKPVAANARVVGGRITVDDTVGGDLMAVGGFVTVTGKAKNTYVGGGTVEVTNGSNGAVTIYGVDVTLAGEFNGDVEVVASDKVTVSEGTAIHGIFKYNGPQQADIPVSAHIDGGVDYIGSAAYLPTVQQAKTFAAAGLWVFFIVQLAAAIVATGLIAGLFPVFTDRVVEMALTRTPERFILLALLGFAGFVATPVLMVLLAISFVGIGVAFIVFAAYVLFLLISYVYAAVLMGSVLLHFLRRKQRGSAWSISWRGAIIGMVALYLIGLIPFVGLVVKVVLSATAGGALLTLFYQFAFRRGLQDMSDF
jgi:hypothetical protein